MLTKEERWAKRIAVEDERLCGFPYKLASTPVTVLTLLNDLDAKDEEIARITALNTQQAVRMAHLSVLAVGCSKHSSYRAKRKITTFCATCNLMWAASEALREMAKEDKPNG